MTVPAFLAPKTYSTPFAVTSCLCVIGAIVWGVLAALPIIRGSFLSIPRLSCAATGGLSLTGAILSGIFAAREKKKNDFFNYLKSEGNSEKRFVSSAANLLRCKDPKWLKFLQETPTAPTQLYKVFVTHGYDDFRFNLDNCLESFSENSVEKGIESLMNYAYTLENSSNFTNALIDFCISSEIKISTEIRSTALKTLGKMLVQNDVIHKVTLPKSTSSALHRLIAVLVLSSNEDEFVIEVLTEIEKDVPNNLNYHHIVLEESRQSRFFDNPSIAHLCVNNPHRKDKFKNSSIVNWNQTAKITTKFFNPNTPLEGSIIKDKRENKSKEITAKEFEENFNLWSKPFPEPEW